MGADANLFLENRGTRLNPEDIWCIAVRMSEAFGAEQFEICPPGNEWGEVPHHALVEVDADKLDQPHFADIGQVIEVSWLQRYYGPGYERGAIKLILAVADWLSRQLPNVRIWYGPDNRPPDELTPELRESLLSHFAKWGHKPYEERE